MGTGNQRVAYSWICSTVCVYLKGLLTSILYGSKFQIITSESTGKDVFELTSTSQAASSAGGMLELQRPPFLPPAQLIN